MADTFCGATHRPVRNRRRRNRRQDISPLGISATTRQREGGQGKVRGRAANPLHFRRDFKRYYFFAVFAHFAAVFIYFGLTFLRFMRIFERFCAVTFRVFGQFPPE